MIKHDVKLLEVGVASYSGVIYNEEATKIILDQFAIREVCGFYNDGAYRPTVNPSHIVTKAARVGDIVTGTIVVMDSHEDGKLLRDALLAGKNVVFTPTGFGRIENNEIVDFQFMGINAILDNVEVI